MQNNLTNAECPVGTRIWFAEENRPYKVRARGSRYLVCTKPFNPKRTVLYTVIDTIEKVRGTENLVLGMGAETDQDCLDMIERLEKGCGDFGRTEVSRRNRIDLRIARINLA